MENEKKKNKNIKWAVLVAAFVIICNIAITELTTEKPKELENITYTRYKEELAEEGTKLILLNSNNCSECDSMNEVLKQIINEQDLEAYSIDIDELSDTELSDLTSSITMNDASRFPLLLHINDGAVIDSYEGDAIYDDILTFASRIKPITVNQYIELMKEDVEIFVYIGRPTCSYCVKSEPWLKSISYEMGKDIFYINIDEISESDHGLLADITKGIYRQATPLFIISKGNEIIDYLEGAGSFADLNNFFRQTNLR